MEITVNQKSYQLDAACSVSQMLEQVFDTGPRNIAVAVNETVVPKHEWPERLLNQGDQVMIIKATQGG